MPDPDPTRTDAAAASGDLEEEHIDEADAWEALAEDRQRQLADSPAAPTTELPPDTPETVGAAPAPPTAGTTDTPETAPAPQTPTQEAATTPARRVFVIDAKEYPDPDPDLPIAGARSVQAMYRDYFPGQLDNADVVEKTRDDGTLEVTFKRRIGTKGGRRVRVGAGEVAISVARVVGLVGALPPDRPLVWDLIEQAVAPDGALRLQYAPPAAQLNLAEAQQIARARQIEHTVGELRRLRPTG